MARPLAALAVLAGLAGPPRAEAAPPGFYGVSGSRLVQADYKLMESAGVGAYRVVFHFRHARYAKGQLVPDWGRFDRLFAATSTRGIELIPILIGSPRWLTDHDARPPIDSARQRALWRELLAALARRYGPGGTYWLLNPLAPRRPIRTWQVWNEPNDPAFFAPRPSTREYADLLRISARAIRSVNPGARILTAGIVSRPEHRHAVPGPAFIRRLLRRPDARGVASAIAVHPYGRTSFGVRRNLRAARRAINRSGGRRLPIWVTEVGWGSRGRDGGRNRQLKTASGQARALRRTFSMIDRARGRLGIDRALWYQWRDGWDPRCMWCRSAGLVDVDRAPKPALAEFRDAATHGNR